MSGLLRLTAVLAALCAATAGVHAAGSAWTPVAQFAGPSICSLEVSPDFQRDGTVWAGTPGNGLYFSTDGGQSWQSDTTLPQAFSGSCPLALSPAYSADHTIIAVSDQAYISHDAGLVWTGLRIPVAPATIAFSPSYASDRTILATTDAGPIYRTTDGGVDWTRTGDWQRNLTASGHFIATRLIFAANGSALLATTDGIFRSLDAGRSWSAASDGLPVTRTFDPSTGNYFSRIPPVTGVAVSSAENFYAVLSKGFQAVLFRSTDQGSSWSRAGTPVEGSPSALMSLGDSSTKHGLVLGTHDRGVLLSHDQGAHWQDVTGMLPDEDVSTLDHNNRGDVFLGTSFDGVFTTSHVGWNWKTLYQGMPQTDPALSLTAPKGSGSVLAGTLSGVYRSSNITHSWQPSDSGLPGERSVTGFAVAHSGTRRAVFAATVSGVYRSLDVGKNWSLVGSAAMRGVVAFAVATSTSARGSNDVAAGTENGLYYSADGGEHWRDLGAGDMNVTALRFSGKAGNDLYTVCSGELIRYRSRVRTVIAADIRGDPIDSFLLSHATGAPAYAVTPGGLFAYSHGMWRRRHGVAAGSAQSLVYAGGAVVLGSGDTIAIGRDAGRKWRSITTPGASAIRSILTLNAHQLLVSLDDGELWRLND